MILLMLLLLFIVLVYVSTTNCGLFVYVWMFRAPIYRINVTAWQLLSGEPFTRVAHLQRHFKSGSSTPSDSKK
jgi:hypothetical protein